MVSFFLSFFVVIQIINGELRLNGVFRDNMVLQEPNDKLKIRPTYIYGEAFLNETVIITGSKGFPLINYKIIPKQGPVVNQTDYGNWSVAIIPNITDPSYPGPYTINISSIWTSNGKETMFLSINNTYFGDVFLCVGQSNMQYEVGDTDNKSYEYSIAKNYPNIRYAIINEEKSFYPIQNVSIAHNEWSIPFNHSIKGFSAICWMNGRMTSDYLKSKGTTRYIGLLESAVGGTSVHLWAPGSVGLACNSTGQLPDNGEANPKNAGQLFHTMINPLSMNGIGLSLKQIMYYQGEADAGENDKMSFNAYVCELSQLIIVYRQSFKLPNIPFINIQLPAHGGIAPYKNNDGGFVAGQWSTIQIAQNTVFKLVNNTGLVTTQDLGQNTLHYSHKTPVSVRATLWTKYLTYNDLTINPESPRFNYAYKIAGQSVEDLSVYIKISNVGVKGLQLNEAYHCYNFPATQIQVYTDKQYDVMCCSMGGANVIRMRLEGIYYSLGNENGKKSEYPYLWNWVPAN
eukprot:420578_1